MILLSDGVAFNIYNFLVMWLREKEGRKIF